MSRYIKVKSWHLCDLASEVTCISSSLILLLKTVATRKTANKFKVNKYRKKKKTLHERSAKVTFQEGQMHWERASFVAQTVSNPPVMQEAQVQSPDQSKTPWRRECLPTPVCLPGKFHGQRSLMGYSPWGRKESDTVEWLTSGTRGLSVCLFSTVYFILEFSWHTMLLVSGAQQSSLTIHMHWSSPFKVPFHLGCYTIMSSIPCATQHVHGTAGICSLLWKIQPAIYCIQI